MTKVSTCAIAVFAICGSTCLQAEQHPVWTYPQLVSQSDLITVCEFIAERPTDDHPMQDDPLARWPTIGVVTTFNVGLVFRGEARTTLEVLHYEMKPGTNRVNGPDLVQFVKELPSHQEKTKSDNVEVGPCKVEYLLFLHKRADGRYEPVSGQYDSAAAVKQVESPRTLPDNIAPATKAVVPPAAQPPKSPS